MKNGKLGFSLIELMIVVAVIAILAAIAYPSYIQYKLRTNRADVESEMMRVAQRLQSYKAVNFNYTSATLTGVGGIATYPSASPVFNLTLTTAAQTWTLTATPISTSIQKDDGALTITHTGTQCWYKGKDSPTALDTCSAWSGK
nr:type IV pilin protein [Acinetobacter lwoffii]